MGWGLANEIIRELWNSTVCRRGKQGHWTGCWKEKEWWKRLEKRDRRVKEMGREGKRNGRRTCQGETMVGWVK